MKIQRLQHVGMPFPGSAESVAQARHFYREVLGLTEIPSPPTLPGVILGFVVGDQEIEAGKTLVVPERPYIVTR